MNEFEKGRMPLSEASNVAVSAAGVYIILAFSSPAAFDNSVKFA